MSWVLGSAEALSGVCVCGGGEEIFSYFPLMTSLSLAKRTPAVETGWTDFRRTEPGSESLQFFNSQGNEEKCPAEKWLENSGVHERFLRQRIRKLGEILAIFLLF